jgi:hypothetical protein
VIAKVIFLRGLILYFRPLHTVNITYTLENVTTVHFYSIEYVPRTYPKNIYPMFSFRIGPAGFKWFQIRYNLKGRIRNISVLIHNTYFTEIKFKKSRTTTVFFRVLRTRDRSRIRLFSIPDPIFSIPDPGSAPKNLSI